MWIDNQSVEDMASDLERRNEVDRGLDLFSSKKEEVVVSKMLYIHV